MFDAKTFKSLKRIPAAKEKHAIVYDAPSDRVFTLNGDAHSSTVIDSSGDLVTNIPFGGKPEYGASSGDGKVYANLTDVSEVVEIDAKSATVTRRWPTAPCKQPVSMALDAAHHRAFSGCRSGVMAVSDYQTGKVRWSHELGEAHAGSGVLTTDSGLTFTGDASGNFIVADTSDGKILWHAGSGGHIESSPITYELDGAQYVITSSSGVLFAWTLPAK